MALINIVTGMTKTSFRLKRSRETLTVKYDILTTNLVVLDGINSNMLSNDIACSGLT